MQKPPSVRVAGWAFLALAVLCVWLIIRSGLLDHKWAVVIGNLGLLISTFGFGIVWLAGTAAWRARAAAALKNVEEKADNMTFRRLQAMAGPRLHIGEPPQGPGPEAKDCAACGRPTGILRCLEHRGWLCWNCAATHAVKCAAGFDHIVRGVHGA